MQKIIACKRQLTIKFNRKTFFSPTPKNFYLEIMRPTHSEYIFILFDHMKLAIGKGILMHMHIGTLAHHNIFWSTTYLQDITFADVFDSVKLLLEMVKIFSYFVKKKPSFRIISDLLELLDTKHQSIDISNGSSNDFGPRLILPSYDVNSKWSTLIRIFPDSDAD